MIITPPGQNVIGANAGETAQPVTANAQTHMMSAAGLKSSNARSKAALSATTAASAATIIGVASGLPHIGTATPLWMKVSVIPTSETIYKNIFRSLTA